MKTVRLGAMIAAAVTACMFGLSSPAVAKGVTHVHPGESIQAAVDAASPGDTIKVDPGVYVEQVVIEKDGITLQGSGADPTGTVIQAPATTRETDCSEGAGPTDFQDGVCVFGLFSPVVGVTVTDLLVRGFNAGGLTDLGATNLVVRNVRVDGNAEGMLMLLGSHTLFENSVASNNLSNGFFVTDSPDADATIKNVEAYGNRVGVLFDDSSDGSLTGSDLHDNCAGVAVENAGGGADNWTLKGNTVESNNKTCPKDFPYEGFAAVSGVGISLQGATGTTVRNNEVRDNLGPRGGIELHSTAYAGGSDPMNDLIQNNHASGNTPYDLAWDGSGTGIVFQNNHCDTSNPAGLCR
ncbi:MAG: nitrous oxide reductase family maturation protein NosD [Actinomycetota bacterium]